MTTMGRAQRYNRSIAMLRRSVQYAVMPTEPDRGAELGSTHVLLIRTPAGELRCDH